MPFVPDFSDIPTPKTRLYQATLKWREKPIQPYDPENPNHQQGQLVHQQLLICAENSQEAESIARQRMPYYLTDNRNAIIDADASIRLTDYGEPLPRRVYLTTPVIPAQIPFHAMSKKAIRRVLIDDPKTYLEKLAATISNTPANPTESYENTDELKQELTVANDYIARLEQEKKELLQTLHDMQETVQMDTDESTTASTSEEEYQPTCDDYADIAEVYTETFAATLFGYDPNDKETQAYQQLIQNVNPEHAELLIEENLQLPLADILVYFASQYEQEIYFPAKAANEEPETIRQFTETQLQGFFENTETQKGDS